MSRMSWEDTAGVTQQEGVGGVRGRGGEVTLAGKRQQTPCVREVRVSPTDRRGDSKVGQAGARGEVPRLEAVLLQAQKGPPFRAGL